MEIILDEERKKILEATTHVLIIGGPGSGKTTIALMKASRYLEERKAGREGALFLSFSRAAVSRINESMNVAVADESHKQFLSIQTFHSFFWEILKTHGYLIGAPYKLRILSPHDEDAFRYGRAKDSVDWLKEREDLFFQDGRVSFDLFSPMALRILSQSLAIRNIYANKYPLIFVDEAQDTDREQWEAIKLFALKSQIILMADLDQQIHDYRSDVTAERINEIASELQPLSIQLGAQNHRSSTTEITQFARDLLANTPRATPYNGVTLFQYSPQSVHRDNRIRQSVGMLSAFLRDHLGEVPASIAVLATWNNGVKIISNALRGKEGVPEIRHRVQFDENSTYLSSRLIAFLMEPKNQTSSLSDLFEALKIMSSVYRVKENRKEWEKYERWCSEIENGVIPKKGKVIPELIRIIQEVGMKVFTGNPELDWLSIKDLLIGSSVRAIQEMGAHTEYLMAFNRGKLISGGLVREWQKTGTYSQARSILDSAIVATQIVSENKDSRGINVMTIHKAKGKEFDGVIIFQNQHSSPFVLPRDDSSFSKSRKLLFVGITRARYRVLILKDASSPCLITGRFRFNSRF